MRPVSVAIEPTYGNRVAGSMIVKSRSAAPGGASSPSRGARRRPRSIEKMTDVVDAELAESVTSLYVRRLEKAKRRADVELAALRDELRGTDGFEALAKLIDSVVAVDVDAWRDKTKCAAVVSTLTENLRAASSKPLRQSITRALMIVSTVSRIAAFFHFGQFEIAHFVTFAAEAFRQQAEADAKLLQSIPSLLASTDDDDDDEEELSSDSSSDALVAVKVPSSPSLSSPALNATPERAGKLPSDTAPPRRPARASPSPPPPSAPITPLVRGRRPTTRRRTHKWSVQSTPRDAKTSQANRFVLCRICENQVKQNRFEEHSSTCLDYTQMETQIHFIDESLNRVANDLASDASTPSDVKTPLRAIVMRVIGTHSSVSDEQARICSSSLQLYSSLLARIRSVHKRTPEMYAAVGSMIRKKQIMLKQQRRRLDQLQSDFAGFASHRRQVVVGHRRAHTALTAAPMMSLVNRSTARRNQSAAQSPGSPRARPPGLAAPPSSPSGAGAALKSRDVVSIRDFEIIKPISRGSFGHVVLARKRATGDVFAIKILKKKEMVRKNQDDHARNERNILAVAHDCPYVVKLIYSFQSHDSLYLVMEYLNGGDTFSLLRVFGSFGEDMARMYIAETVLALEYLHERGIVHRDLKVCWSAREERGEERRAMLFCLLTFLFDVSI
jgi:Protein kinase domain